MPPVRPATETSYNLGDGSPLPLVAAANDSVWYANGHEFGHITAGGIATTYSGLTEQTGYIALGPDGNVWLGLQTGVARFTPSESFSILSIHGTPGHLVEASDGSLWVAEDRDGRIVHVAADGGEIDYQLPSSTAPETIVWGPDSAAWFTTANNTIGRLAPDGSYSEIGLDGLARDLTLGPEGNLWVGVRTADTKYLETGEIQEWTSAGRLVLTVSLDVIPIFLGFGAQGSLWFTAASYVDYWAGHGDPDVGLWDWQQGQAHFVHYRALSVDVSRGIAVTSASIWVGGAGGIARFIP
jgi:hypothetical protein